MKKISETATGIVIDQVIRQLNINSAEEDSPEGSIESSLVVPLRIRENILEVFVGYRTAGGFQDQWGCPGGKIDKKDKSPLQGAQRETGEEAWIVPSSERFHQVGVVKSSVSKQGQDVQFKIYVFLLNAEDLPLKNTSLEEHREMKWVPVSEALQSHNNAVQASPELDPSKIQNTLTPRLSEILEQIDSILLPSHKSFEI